MNYTAMLTLTHAAFIFVQYVGIDSRAVTFAAAVELYGYYHKLKMLRTANMQYRCFKSKQKHLGLALLVAKKKS